MLPTSGSLKIVFDTHIVKKVFKSIKNVLKDGYRTKDIASFKEDGIKVLTTCEMGDMIVKYIENS